MFTRNLRVILEDAAVLGAYYIRRAGPVSRESSVCRDEFQPGVTSSKLARGCINLDV